jgi:hypothetical protein
MRVKVRIGEVEGSCQDLFKSPAIGDPVLGVLERARGTRRCRLSLNGEQIALLLGGSSRKLDSKALEAARRIAPAFSAWSPYIQQTLFDRHTPYPKAANEGEAPGGGVAIPIIAGSEPV